MKLEDQVCSLELAKRLKELGVKQESIFYHVDNFSIGYEGIRFREQISIPKNKPVLDSGVIKFFSAFTVAELGEMLPSQIASHRVEDADPIYWISWAREKFNRGHVQSQDAPTEVDARAKMLIYLIENGLMGGYGKT